MNLPPVLRQRYFDTNGVVLAGGLLYAYISGTTTPQATYTDAAGGTPNANPVVLDANGEAAVWLDPTLSYKFVLKNSAAVTQWTVDSVIGIISAGAVVSTSLNADAIHGQTADTSPQSVDELLTWDSSAAALKKVTKANMLKLPLVSKTTTYTATAEDHVILVSAAAAWTLSLPTAVGITGKEYIVKRTDDVPTQIVTVDPSGSETINGFLTVSHIRVGDTVSVVSNGTNWELRSISKSPVVQKFTSGTSQTYTTGLGARYIRVRMVGGGGGGSGSQSGGTTGGTGGTGGDTTFGTALLSASGGVGGAQGANAGSGGAASLGSGPVGLAMIGGDGVHGGYIAALQGMAGSGGVSFLGGAPKAGINTAGIDGKTNSGSGGSGGQSAVNDSVPGSGGGAGGYVDAIIYNPSVVGPTFTYSVGVAGAAGAAGSVNGKAGGAGAAGIILVEEFY